MVGSMRPLKERENSAMSNEVKDQECDEMQLYP